jgi:hypothetical protein
VLLFSRGSTLLLQAGGVVGGVLIEAKINFKLQEGCCGGGVRVALEFSILRTSLVRVV